MRVRSWLVRMPLLWVFEGVVAEEGVDAGGDPVGVEDVGVFKDGVFAKVED